jgi:hypothetical protein
MGAVMNKGQPVDAARPVQRRDQEMPRETAPGKTGATDHADMPPPVRPPAQFTDWAAI